MQRAKRAIVFAIAANSLLAAAVAHSAIDLQLPDAKERAWVIGALSVSTGAEISHERTDATPAPFPTEKPCTIARTRTMGKSKARAGWVRSFLDTLQLPDAPEPLGDCLRSECASDAPDYDNILIELQGRKGAVRAHVALDQGIVSLTGKKQQPICIDVRDRVEAILVLLKQALPEDSGLDQVRLCSAPDSASAAGSSSTRQVTSEALPDLQWREPPEYPLDAVEDKIAGSVRVRALVGRDGTVQATMVLDSIRRLDAAAVRSVEQTKFKPAMKNGMPVPVWVVVPVRFSLQ